MTSFIYLILVFSWSFKYNKMSVIYQVMHWKKAKRDEYIEGKYEINYIPANEFWG